jgi:ligand-binding sensor domain-containing protein
MKLTARLILFLLLAVQIYGYAQVAHFQNYELLRKNHAASITCLIQDPSGFVWAGTNKGLFKLDGRTIRQFTLKDSLADIHVTAMSFDSLGRLWLGYTSGAMSYLEDDRIVSFQPEEGHSTAAISSILFDHEGTLWFSTLNDGLYYYRNNRLFRLDEQEGLPDLYVYNVVEDRTGRIIAATDRGLAICSFQNDKIVVDVVNSEKGLPDNIVKKVSLQPDGGLLVATEEKGIFLVDLDTQKFTPVIPDWQYGSVSDFVAKENEIWIASIEKGLLVYDTQLHTMQIMNDDVAEGLSSVRVLLNDDQGNIWCGSRKNLLHTIGTALQFYDFENSNDIQAVTVDKAGTIWYANAKGLFTLTVQEGRPIPSPALKNFNAFKSRIISLYTDDYGYIWAGYYGEGLIRIDPRKGSIERSFNQIRNGNVLGITGKKNVVWLATLGGASRIVMNEDAYTVENYSTANGLTSDFIYQVFIDSKGRTWFATDGDGIDMFDGNDFHNFKTGLPSQVVYGLTEDGNGKIWANVQGYGVFVFDEKEAFISAFTGEMRHNDIYSISTDKVGNVILAHDLGIDIINSKGNKIKFLGDETGLKNRTVNLNAVGKDAAGNLFFATSQGIVRFTEGKDLLAQSPVARINSVKLFDRELSMNKLKSLSYDENNLTINFVGLWFRNPESLQYYYKLDNYDVDWISTTNTSVTYSQLPPGEYTFKIKVADNGNLPQEDQTEFTISIRPPFWRTYAFYSITILLLLISTYGFIKFRERKLRRDKFILEARVKRRTFEIQRQNDEIQAQNEEIMAQAEEIKGINENLEMLVHERTAELERKNTALEEYAFINAHKLRSPVASILGLVNLISRTGLDPEGKEISNRLKQSAEELDDIVRSITKAIEKGDKSYTRKQ